MQKKILSIDGGGIKGVFPASFLASIEETLGDKVSNYFDLIVGTSTGGIIALGLGLGIAAKDILKFYEELGPSIFHGSKISKLIRRLYSSKYNQKPLSDAVTNTFGQKKLGESTKRLVIPSLNLETGEVHLFKTAHHPRLEKDYKIRAVDVALATAAAPTYFPTFQSSDGIPLVDGGMWANNPLGVAVVEAIGILQWQPSTVKVLSLGCTTETLNVSKKAGVDLGLQIVDVFMSAQSSASISTGQVLIGKENIIRISPNVAKDRFTLDGIEDILSLKGLGNSEARKALPELRRVFFDNPVELFEPYHKL
jgi:patatin-like phospholipase/acyl hydrolase